MPTQTSGRPRALVTGASSGIGAAFAKRLARDQYDLVIVARRRDKLESLAKQLQDEHHAAVQVIAADLSQPADLRTVEKRVAEDSALELLVNNAGFGGYMSFVTLDPDRAEEVIRVQVIAVTRLTRAALPGMIERGRGAIVNVSSRLAFSGSVNAPRLPKRATYAATKSYINTFTQILANELAGTGAKVQALCPGVVSTEFHQKMGIDPAQFPPAIVSTPESVVAASLAALRLGEVVCLPGLSDPSLLSQLQENEQRLFDQSNVGEPAARYKA